ncbi:MAG TPA: hypothetical protein VGE11_26880 [Pseudonocardia sp.]
MSVEARKLPFDQSGTTHGLSTTATRATTSHRRSGALSRERIV